MSSNRRRGLSGWGHSSGRWPHIKALVRDYLSTASVEYGYVYPVTTGGKIFTFFVAVTGLGVVAVPTALLASALTKTKRREDQ